MTCLLGSASYRESGSRCLAIQEPHVAACNLCVLVWKVGILSRATSTSKFSSKNEISPTTFKSLLLFGNLQVPISKAVVLQNDFPPSHRTIFYPPIRKLEELFSLLEKDLMLI